MRSFALFRLPYEKRCTLVVQTTGVPQELMACNELSGQQGFVMAPFAVSPSHPLLLIRADEVTSDLTDLDGLSDLVDTHGLTALDKGVHAISMRSFVITVSRSWYCRVASNSLVLATRRRCSCSNGLVSAIPA